MFLGLRPDRGSEAQLNDAEEVHSFCPHLTRESSERLLPCDISTEAVEPKRSMGREESEATFQGPLCILPWPSSLPSL
ncbi:hypothetical protein GN956_G20781 [Arapaima gigas]